MQQRSDFWMVPAHAAYGVVAVITFVVITIPTIGLLAVVPGEQNRRRLVRAAARLIFRLIGAAPRVSGLERLPEGPCVVVANHASYADGIILTAVLPPRFTYVIKHEMTRVPLAHFLLRRIGSEFVDRSSSNRRSRDLRRLYTHALQQRSLVFFPEGTFAEEPGLRRFHSGAFAAAVFGQAAVVPVVIRGSRQLLSSGRWLPAPARLEVRVLSPITQDAVHGDAARLMQVCRQSILAELDEPDAAGTDGWRQDRQNA